MSLEGMLVLCTYFLETGFWWPLEIKYWSAQKQDQLEIELENMRMEGHQEILYVWKTLRSFFYI